MSTSLEDLLERHFSEAYKREMDQDESVWRSLPFFATSLILSATLVGYVYSQLPSIGANWSALLMVEYLLFAACFISLVAAGGNLWGAVHTRRYRHIPYETETLDYLRSLRSKAAKSESEIQKADEDAAKIARRYMNEEYAEATTHNRKANAIRLGYRSMAVRMLFIAWTCAVALTGIMFIEDVWVGVANAGSSESAPAASGAAALPTGEPSSAAATDAAAP